MEKDVKQANENDTVVRFLFLPVAFAVMPIPVNQILKWKWIHFVIVDAMGVSDSQTYC